MADPTIKIKRSAVEGKIPTADQLPLGEIALNTYDGKVFASKNVGIGTTVFAVNPWSVGTGTNTYNTYFTAGSVGIGTTNPVSKLDVRGDITLGTSGINTISSTTDIQSWYYTNKSKTPGDDTAPTAVYVGASGTAMFMVGDTGNDINQYTLSTPYDVSTAGASVGVFSVATQETNPSGIDFNPTGTKMFISGQNGNSAQSGLTLNAEYVHEYSLSTAWTVSSAGYTTSFSVTAQETAPQGVTFGNSGAKMYVVGSSGDAVYQYSLSTPYSIASGVTYDNISLVLGTNPVLLETAPIDISFNSTGTVLWIAGSANDRIYEFRLGTAWDISTAVFYDDIYIGFNEITVTGLHVIPEQNVAYIVGSNSDTIYQYSTNTPALEISSSGISSVSSIILNNETRVKDKLYVKGLAHFDSNIVAQANVQVDGTFTTSSTVTFDTTTSTINFGTSQTTGTLILGGTSQTGAITLGRATTSQTTNIQAGVTASGNQKTINLGTGGASGSRTLITVGSTTAGAASTVFIPSPTNLLIGTATTTGTASQPLQVTGGAYVSGSVGIGTINPEKPLHLLSSVPTPLIIQRVSAANAAIEYRNPTSSMWAGLASNALGWGVAASDNVGSSAQILVTRTGGELLVGILTATGTASQRLQVDGGAYVSGSVGIGITNPESQLHLYSTSGDTKLIIESDGDNNNEGDNAFIIFRQDGGSEESAIWNGNWTGSNDNQLILANAAGGVGGGIIFATGSGSGYTTADEAMRITPSRNVGVGTTNPTSKLSVSGDGNFTGVVTATTFFGALTGTATTASSVTANSVGLGTGTFGDYVKDITGTANQITVTGGTGEGSTPTLSLPIQVTIPQDLTVLRDVQIDRNLNVTGNITIGGTSGTLFTETLKISDSDIILGFRTDAFNNDVSNDTTANHGGIAVASTEGTPLVNFNIVGIETLPPTYKKIMWFKAGEFAGLGTDAWLFNYAVGIGSTQVPNGVRLAAGGMQVTDSTISSPQLNISGVSTLGNTSTTNLTAQQLNVSGVSTFTGAVSFGTSAYFGDNDTLNFGDSNDLQIYHDGSNSYVRDVGTGDLVLAASSNVAILNSGLNRTLATFTQGGSVSLYHNNTKEFETTGAGVTVFGTTETQQLVVSGVSTSSGGFVGNLTGTATTATVAQGLTGTPNITVGVVTATSFVKSGGTLGEFLKADGSVDTNTYLTSYTETDTLNSVTGRGNITTNGISVGILTATSGNFSGIVTSSGAVISGATTATSFVKSGGTSSEFLKADGSVDTSTYLTTTGSGTNLTGIVTSIVAGTGVTISGSTGQVTINSTASGGGVGVGVSIYVSSTPPSISTSVGNYWVDEDDGIVYTWFDDGNSKQWVEFGPVSFSNSSGGGTSSQWVTTNAGIHTLSNVGIGTTNPTSKLTVSGDGNFTGVVTATSFSGSGANLTNLNIPAGFNELDAALFS